MESKFAYHKGVRAFREHFQIDETEIVLALHTAWQTGSEAMAAVAAMIEDGDFRSGSRAAQLHALDLQPAST